MHLVDTWVCAILLSALKKQLYLNGCRPFETLSHVFLMSSLKRFRRTVAHLIPIKLKVEDFETSFEGKSLKRFTEEAH
jgi:hypothetical protein